MFSKHTSNNPLILVAFLISILYWSYHASISQFVLAHDSIGYEQLGRFLYENPFLDYFKDEVRREPIYPLTIALSMHIGKWLSLPYQSIQIFLQLFILFLTQIITFKILKTLKVNAAIIAFIILYIGISPSLVNSALSLYSEIATYPFILGIVLCFLSFWKDIHPSNQNLKALARSSVLLSLGFVGITFVKAIFEIITPILFIFLLFLIILINKNDRKSCIRKAIIFLSLFSLTYLIPITSYKTLNKTFNSNFALTDRGAWALYGNTARRMEPLNKQKALAAATYVPTWKFCNKFFTAEECDFWSYKPSDHLGAMKRNELSSQMGKVKVNQELLKLSRKKILENPPQYIFLWGIESLKMYFWEAPNMQYVAYPKPIISIYSYKPINIGIYVIMPCLTFLAFWTIFIYIWRNRKDFFSENIDEYIKQTTLFSIEIIIIIHMGILSFFFINQRYIFPLAPLYLILIALMLQLSYLKILKKNRIFPSKSSAKPLLSSTKH